MNQGYLPTSSGILQGDGGVPAQTVHPGQVVVVVKGGEDGLSTKATLQDEEHLHQRSTAGVDVEWEEAGEQQQGEGEEGEGQQLEPLKPPPRSFVRTFTCLPWEVSGSGAWWVLVSVLQQSASISTYLACKESGAACILSELHPQARTL
jgi:hypothetical protein